MKPLGPRAQWLLASVLIPAFALFAAGAFWLQARSHAGLEAAFQRELGLLVQLPRLREDVRRLEEATNRYLVGGDRRQLDVRRRVLEDLRRLEAGLAAAAEGAEERALTDRLGRELAAVLSEQEQWIARRSQGRLGGSAASRLTSREDAVAEVVEVLVGLKDANRARLDERRRAMERSGRVALGLLLAAGALLGGSASAYLSARLAEAVELGAVKTQLVAMVSHEFNNSLSVLGGMTRLLKEDDPKPPDPKRLNYFTVIESHIRSLAVASRTLLEMGRLEAGRLKVRPVRMDLTATARECCTRLEVLWSRKGQAVSVEAPADPVWVHGDPDALALVATNLLANAVKYTPEKGTVTVAVRAGAGGGEFSVKDTGIGIAPEDQKHILSGYYRTEAGKKAAKGFGVGLALSQAVLAAHGSELKVESAPGRGARFAFELPAPPGPPPAG
ncbi:HAMP domain-containing histidine kinase [bacterium]|nr:MAG: HAMP domain-containing histidine kinase [bacterium]